VSDGAACDFLQFYDKRYLSGSGRFLDLAMNKSGLSAYHFFHFMALMGDVA